VKTLSAAREPAALARLFSRPANVLVLDEPTNDLDIETLELLESCCRTIRHAVPREPRPRLPGQRVTQTIAWEGEAGEGIRGGYDDWQRARRPRGSSAADAGSPGQRRLAQRRRKTKLSFNEGASWRRSGPHRGARARAAGLAAQLADPAIYQDRGAT